MEHKVFISHSSRDAKIASAICKCLEANGIGCWIAPRDIPKGDVWDVAITAGIRSCSVLLLVFSSNANSSDNVANEVSIASSIKTKILPVRIENVELQGGLSYYLPRIQWFEASGGWRKNHCADLVQTVSEKLNIDPPPTSKPKPFPWPWAAAAAALVAGGAAYAFYPKPTPVPNNGSSLQVFGSGALRLLVDGSKIDRQALDGSVTFKPIPRGASQACLEIKDMPPQEIPLAPSGNSRFNIPGDVDWPIILLHGTAELFHYLPESDSYLELRWEENAKVERYRGGVVCVYCGGQAPADLLKQALGSLPSSERNVGETEEAQYVFSRSQCGAPRPAMINLQVFAGNTTLLRTLSYQLDSTALLASKVAKQPCRVAIGPERKAGVVNSCDSL